MEDTTGIATPAIDTNDDAPAVVKEEEPPAVIPLSSDSKKGNSTSNNNEGASKDDEQSSSTTKTTEVVPPPTEGTSTTSKDSSSPANNNNNKNNTSSSSRKDWDYTNRKIMVKNVLKFIDKKKLKKMIDSWVSDFNASSKKQVKVDKFKKPPRDAWVILTIDSEENVQPFMDHLNNNDKYTNKKGEKIQAVKVVDEDEKKEYQNNNNNHNGKNKRRRNDNDEDETLTKRQKSQRDLATFVPRVVTEEEVKDKIIPLWRNTYEQQVETKQKEIIKRCAIRVVKEIKNKFRELEKEAKRNPTNRKSVKVYPWLLKQRAVEIAPILHAKDIVRNKCEFTFGPRYILAEQQQQQGEEVKKEDGDQNKIDNNSTDGTGTVPMEDTTTTTTTKPDTNNNDNDTPMEDATATTATAAAGTETKESSDTTTQTETKEDEPSSSQQSSSLTSTLDNIKMIPSIGSMARGWSGGVSHPPSSCKNIPSEAIALIEIVEAFLQDCPMPPYDAKIHTGFWRTMTIRTSRRTNECMIIFVHAPITGGAGSKNDSEVDNYPPEVFETEKSRLIDMLTNKDLPIIPVNLKEDKEENKDGKEGVGSESNQKPSSFLRVTSIFFQEFDGISMPPPEHPVQHAYGAKAITEKLGKCTFQISPGAFFQVNTPTAETLYNVVVDKVREVATGTGTKPEDTLCFDVCCGTGTIGLTLMKEGVVGKVVGVDISAPAIEDAKVNAKLNGFGDDDDTKTRFVAARAENVMLEELRRAKNTNGKIVAVVDPAREGLHANVLKSLRGFSQIDRLVYVSCNPTGSLIQDAVVLCCPPSKRFRGTPFRPTFAQPVDMFPYSNHCELVMVFDRMTDKELGAEEENTSTTNVTE